MSPGSVDVLLGVGYDPDPRLRRETQALAGAGYQVRILAWDRDGTRADAERDGRVRIERVHVKSGWSRGLLQVIFLARVAMQYLRRVRRRRPDVLHAVDLPMLVIALLIAPLAGRPVIVYDAFEVYGVMVSHRLPRWLVHLIDWLERTLPHHASLVITPGETRQAYFSVRGIGSVSVPNWVDPGASMTTRESARADLDLASDRFVILYAGALHASRDVDTLIRHAARCPADLVLVAGQGDDEERLRAQSATLPNVRFLGWLTDPAAILAAADAIYYSLRVDHPYASMAAPNTLYQAIAFGIPLVYRRQGELAIVGDRDPIGEPFDDDPSLDASLDRLRNPERRAEIRKSLKRLQSRYRWSLAAGRLLDAYPRNGTDPSAAIVNGP